MKQSHSDYAVYYLPLLTLEEKVALVSGHDFMYTNPIPRLGIPSVRMSDGPHGLRVQKPGELNVMASSPATAFPTAAMTANSFDPSLTEAMGEAIAIEASYYGIDVVLGPGVNIKRNPLCGRNFEYFSEDPLLAGAMGEGEVRGLQSQGVSASLKHFAFNNEENHRFMGDSVVDMRAAHEIYLKPFERIVKGAKPDTVMNAYNKVNGMYCSENRWLLTDVLRERWGYQGLVMTDWGATHDRVAGIGAGNDLEMPGDTAICRKWIVDAVKGGRLPLAELDERVTDVLNLVAKHLHRKKKTELSWEGHHALAKRIAEESAVLLKNDGVLPLKRGERLCIIGELFEKMRYQGSGSSMINPKHLSTPKDAFDSHGAAYEYFRGYRENETEPSRPLVEEALEGAKGCETILLFLGLTDYQESEGGDRPDMRLPKNQLALANALLEAKKKIIVVLFGGSVVELPFFDGVSGLLHMFLPGQNGGEAAFDLLFGEACPCGKLAETWPLSYEDVPFGDEFGKSEQTLYKESIYVGYRYYITAGKAVRFPFGYGLSYTKFSYEGMSIAQEKGQIKVRVRVRNVGSRYGKEIVQVYASLPHSEVHRPKRELRGFAKLGLKPGESGEAEIVVPESDLSFYNIEEARFALEGGEYLIEAGSSSADILLQKTISVVGERAGKGRKTPDDSPYRSLDFSNLDNEAFAAVAGMEIAPVPPRKPIRLESRFTDLRQTLIGRILYKAVVNVALKDLKKARKLPPGRERDNRIKAALALQKMLGSNSLITMAMSAGTSFPYNFAEGFADLANGHLIRGIRDFIRKIDAPALPGKETK